jgi:hypothetical protein
MSVSPWSLLDGTSDEPAQSAWLHDTLVRNSSTTYLKQFDSPDSVQSFRSRVPLCRYEDLLPYLNRLQEGESDVLFAGRPVAYERTGGSSGGAKLIPFSQEGLLDFQRCIVPWLARTTREYAITGRAYFSISPATRAAEFVGNVPVGLPDAAFLGESAGSVMARQTAVPLEVGHLQDITQWRKQTIDCLKSVPDLELISVWSPTFLLRLLEDIPDPQRCWPRLKVVSCWASGSARRYAEQLKQLLPHAAIQPKGLLSTEGVVTVPGDEGKPVLVRHGFFEFAQGNDLLLEDELSAGAEYEVVITTASGLYRYRTGDRVRFVGHAQFGHAILEFIGRDSLTSDLVGEKLTETFVGKCLEAIPRFAMLVPDMSGPGYVLICENTPNEAQLAMLDGSLRANPQYDYARRLGQLAPLRILSQQQAFSLVERVMLDRGVRLGDVKPVALRTEAFWLPLFEDSLP